MPPKGGRRSLVLEVGMKAVTVVMLSKVHRWTMKARAAARALQRPRPLALPRVHPVTYETRD